MTSRSLSSSLFSGLIAVCLLAAMVGSSLADAPDEDTEARYREEFVEGRRLFEEERWTEARAAFERAYALQPVPLLLFNIGSTYRREGEREQAITYYRRYLSEAGTDAELGELAESTIAELEAELAAMPEPVEPAPALASDPVRDDPPPRPGRTWRVAGVVIAAAGVGALGWSGVEAYRARAAASDLEGLEPGTPWSDEQQQRWDQGERSDERALILGVVGGAALVTGGVVYWLGHRKGRRGAGALTVSPVVGGGQSGLAITGTF